jgi:hypothetical protein
MIAAYHEQRKIIEEHLDKTNETIDLADIEKSIQMLFSLEVNGKTIKELYEAEQYSHDMHNMQQVCIRIWIFMNQGCDLFRFPDLKFCVFDPTDFGFVNFMNFVNHLGHLKNYNLMLNFYP